MSLKKLFAKNDVTSDEVLREKKKAERLKFENDAELKNARSPQASIEVEGTEGIDALAQKIRHCEEKGKILAKQIAQLSEKYRRVKAQEHASELPQLFADCKAAYLDLDKKTRAACVAWHRADAANQAFKAARAYMNANGASVDALLHPVEVVVGGLIAAEDDRAVLASILPRLQHLRGIEVGSQYAGSYLAQAVELMADVSPKTPKIARGEPGDKASESHAKTGSVRTEKDRSVRQDEAVA